MHVLKIMGGIACLLLASSLSAQVTLDYYLPQGVTYDPTIPTPERLLGYEVGEWHVSHDQLVYYFQALADASDRMELEVIGRTYEGRPLIQIAVSSPENLARKASIQAEHRRLSDPQASARLDISQIPLVVNMGYNVHGNESSAGNSALLFGYFLAAAQGPEINQWLNQMVIIIDPCLNPDGLHRFSTWVNMHRGIRVINTDPASREHNEAWPGGRTNHYWFDLNRDWLLAQHPESQARLRSFHAWKPNYLTDYHEMGTNNTYFFQPGVPSRNNPLTPPRVIELTEKMALRYGAALDSIGSLYYTREGYDDFYYGKGSTYPDVNGSVGILFEQASSRGHAQESTHGVLTFPFTIRNQLTTSIATIRGNFALREELLDHQRDFFRSALDEANQDSWKAVVWKADPDRTRAYKMAETILRHDIKVYQLNRTVEIDGERYSPENSFIIPLRQAQYRLIKSMFERRDTFQDSLFYDVSTWTFPLAFGVKHAQLDNRLYRPDLLADPITEAMPPTATLHGGKSDYAYVMPWSEYFSPRALYKLQSAGLRVKVATQPFQGPNGQAFSYGSILIAVAGQAKSADEIFALLQEIVAADQLDIYAMHTGLTGGLSLGSRYFLPLSQPKVAIVVGRGVSGYEAGEAWHLLDYRYHMDVSLLEMDQFNRVDLSRYNTLIMPGGNYGRISTQKLQEWLREGGKIVAYKGATTWLSNQGLAPIERIEVPPDTSQAFRPYGNRSKLQGAQEIGGMIAALELDLSHPIAYGYTQPIMSIFRNSELFLKKTSHPYRHPMVYSENPRLSGYISPQQLIRLAGTAAISISRVGQGRVIAFADNPNFRAFWYGTNKLFANAIFFGGIIR